MGATSVTVTLDLPLGAEAEPAEGLAARLKLLWALDEVRQGRMTRVRAAQVLGVGLDDFLSRAAAHGVDAIDYELDDFQKELSETP